MRYNDGAQDWCPFDKLQRLRDDSAAESRLRHSVPQKIGYSATTPRRSRDDSAMTPPKTRSEHTTDLSEERSVKGRVCHPPMKIQWIPPTSRFNLTKLNLNGGYRRHLRNHGSRRCASSPLRFFGGWGNVVPTPFVCGAMRMCLTGPLRGHKLVFT